MKVSFFQYLPTFNNIKCNLELIKKLIRENRDAITESQLLVFPEYFLSGPLDLGSFKFYKDQLKDNNINKEFEKISKELGGVCIIFGSAIIKKNDYFVNASLVFQNGKKIAQYDKKALIYNENYLCRATSKYPVFSINKIKIGIAICWDLILPEVFRRYTGKVDLVIVPSFWGIGGNALQAEYPFSLEKKYYRELITARAYENAFGLLFVNSVGQYESDFYSDRMMGGSSAVLPPLGEILFLNDKNSCKLHTLHFDFKQLEQFREYYATDKDYFYYKTKNIF